MPQRPATAIVWSDSNYVIGHRGISLRSCAALCGRRDDRRVNGHRLDCLRQDARTSSSRASALSSFVFSAEGELTHQDLAGLGEHALLSGGESAFALTTPQVTHDFRDLDDIAGGELLQICLVTTRPVRGLLGVRRAQHLEDPVQPIRD